jgi:hypothetical protein
MKLDRERGRGSRKINAAMKKKLDPSEAGPDSAGQSGDDQGISGRAEADSESVRELLDEGQAFEAEVVSGVENAPDPDVAEVRTRQVPEDDVPPEYDNQD